MGNSPVAGDKRRKTALTLHSLPHEVILSIVEWTARITLEDRLEQERREHEQEHNLHHGHAHGHPDGPEAIFGGGMGFGMPPIDFNGLGGLGPNVPGDAEDDDGGIGDVPFMQNLFGFLGNGPGAPAPPTFGTLANTTPIVNNAPVDNEGTDDEMPPLESMNSPTLAPSAAVPSATGAGGTTTVPDVLAGDSSAASQLPASAAAPPGVQVEDDDDEAMPPLEASFQTPPPPPHTPGPAAGPALLVAMDGFPTLGDQTSPPASAPLTGNLASEIAHLQQSTNPYTSEDLQDMPDMESPVVSVHAPLAVQNDSDWSTEEEEESTSAALLNGTMETSEDDGDDEDGEDEEEDDEDAADTDEGHGTMPSDVTPSLTARSLPQVAYPDGLPACPYLPLALVNRSFLNAARTLLYGRHIHLSDVYQAHLLLRSLTSAQVSVYDDEPDADDEEARQQQMLSYLVRDVAFDIRSQISLGRGGGSLLIDLIKECPRLERLAYSPDFTRSAQKPLEAALAACRSMKSIQLRGGDLPAKDLIWETRNLAPLLNVWNKLDSLQVLWLKHSINGPLIPAPKIRLVRLSLAYPDITDSDLFYLLKGSKGSLEQLDLHRPSPKLTRSGVAKVIIDHSGTLVSLQLDVTRAWHPVVAMAPPAETAALTEDRAAKSKYLMDGLIGHLKVLSELKLSGSLASTILFARLPKSITVLAFEDNMGLDVPKILALLKKKKTVTNGGTKKSVPVVAPKLQCFTIARSDGAMLSESMMRNLDKVLEQRKACVHWAYYSPTAVWRPDGTPPPPGAMGALGGLLGMAAAAGGAGFPPDFDFPFDFPIPAMPPMF